MTRHKRHTIKLKSMYQWHRYIGITIAFFVIMLSITGILLNHTTEFKLSTRYVKNETLLKHYGIRAPEKVISHISNNIWVSQWGNRLYLDRKNLGETNSQLIGIIYHKEMIVIGLSDSLLLYTPEGELIEKLSSEGGIPPVVTAIGITDNHLLAINSTQRTYVADIDLTSWHKEPQAKIIWNIQESLPGPLYNFLLTEYRGKGLNMERVLLDMHSGRLLGTGGVYFMDVIALLLVFLACSGIWIWTMRLIKKKNRHNI